MVKSAPTDLRVIIVSKLIEIHEITKLCAFAAEARRILNDISVANEINSEVGEMLSKNTTAHNEWIEHDDNLGVVLKGINHQIESLINQVDKAEVTDAIRS